MIPLAKQQLKGNVGTRPGSHLGSAYLTVSFGPPKLTGISGGGRVDTITVGLIQSLAISQQRQIARLFEVGNNLQWLVPSKVRSSLQLSRVLYDGPSLLKYYGYALTTDVWGGFPSAGPSIPVDRDPQIGEGVREAAMERLGVSEEQLAEGSPGSGDLWINLASNVFNNSIGIMISMKQKMPDGSAKTYGATYMENCLVGSHSLVVAADSRVLSEQVYIEYERTTPLDVGSGQTSVFEIEAALNKAFGG